MFKKVSSYLCALAAFSAFILFAGPAHAQSQATINLSFVDALGDPLPAPGWVNISCFQQSGAGTSGMVAQNEVSGSLSVEVSEPRTFACGVSNFSGYGLPVKAQVTVGPNETASANLVLHPLDATIHAVMRDQGNAPVLDPVGGYGAIACSTQDYSQYFSASVADGEDGASVSVLSGFTYRCTYSGSIDGYQAVQGQAVSPNPNDSINYTISFLALDAQATIELRDMQQNPIPAPSGQYPYSISCSSQTGGSVSFQFNSGESSASNAVVGGSTYNCYASSIEGYQLIDSSFEFTAPSNGTATHTLHFRELDASATLLLKDANGNSIPAPNSQWGWSIYCSNDELGNINFSFQSGETSVQQAVVSGTYNCGAYSQIPGYVIRSSSFQLVVPTNGSVSHELIYDALNATLRVSFSNQSGNAISLPETAMLSCSSSNGNQFMSFSAELGSETSEHDLAVLGGRTYSCSLQNMSAHSAIGYPQATVQADETKSLVIPIVALDGSIEVRLKTRDGADVPAPNGSVSVSCSQTPGYQFSYYGQFTEGEASKTLSVVSNNSYYCSVYGLGDSYGSAATTILVPQGGSVIAIITLTPLNAVLTVNLVDKNGNALDLSNNQNAPGVYCSNTQEGQPGQSASGSTNSQTSFSLAVVAGQYSCSSWSTGDYQFDWSDNSAVTVQENGTTVVNLKHKYLGVPITVQLVDGSGNPIAVPEGSGYPNAFCYGTGADTGWYSTQLSIGDTSAIVKVPGNSPYRCGVFDVKGFVFQESGAFQVGESAASTNLVGTALDATITVNLTSNGSPFPVPPGSWSSVNCSDASYSHYFWASVPQGESSVTLPVLGAEGRVYRCGIWLPEVASQAGEIAVAPNAQVNLTLAIVQKDASLTLRLVDAQGQVLTDIPGGNAYSYSANPDVQDYGNSPFSDGIASISVVGGTPYGVGAYFDGGNGSTVTSLSGTTYVVPNFYREVTAPAGGSATADVTLLVSDAVVQANVIAQGADGPAALNGAWVWMSQIVDNPEEQGSYFGSATDQSGAATIQAVSGKKFMVGVWHEDRNFIAPAPVEITLTAGETRNIEFTFTQASYALAVNATAEGALSGSVFCWAYSDAGVNTWSDSVELGQASALSLNAGTWHIGCNGYLNKADGSSEVYYSEPATLVVTAEQTSGTLSVALLPSGTELLNATRSGQGDQALSLDEGVISFDLPPNGAGVGTVAVTVDNISDRAVPSIINEETQNIFDINVTNDANPVTTLNQPATFGFNVDLNPGETGDNVAVYEFDGRVFTGIPTSTQAAPTFGSVRARNGATTVKVSVSLRRVDRTIVVTKRKGTSTEEPAPTPTPAPQPPTTEPTPPGKSLPGAVSNIKAKVNKKSGKIQITWAAASEAETYSVKIYGGKKLTKVVFNKQVSASTLKLLAKKLKAGKYRIEIIASNSAGSGTAATKNFKVGSVGKNSGGKK